MNFFFRNFRRELFAHVIGIFVCSSLLAQLHAARQLPHRLLRNTSQSPTQNMLMLPVTVRDSRGDYVTGLIKDAFTVYGNKTPQQILTFIGDDAPTSVGVLTEISLPTINGKNQGVDAFNDVVTRLRQLTNSLNEYFLVDFNNLTNSPQGIFRNAKYQKRAILFVKVGGNGPVLDRSVEGLYGLLMKTSVPIYFVDVRLDENAFLGISPSSQTALITDNREALQEITETSGGMMVQARNLTALNKVCESIAGELGHQYLLGFQPNVVPTGNKPHQLKVEVKMPINSLCESRVERSRLAGS